MSDRMPVPVERRELAAPYMEAAYPVEVVEAPHKGVSILTLLARRWKLAAATAAIIIAAGLPAVWLLIKPEYVAEAAIRVDPVNQAIVFSDEAGPLPFYSNYVNTQAALIMSGRILHPVLEDPQVRNLDYLRGFEDPMVELETNLHAKADRNSQLIAVSMTGTDAGAVAEIVNAAVRAFMRIEGGTEATSEDEKLRRLETDRDASSEKLRGLYEAAYQLGEEFGATDLSSREKVMLERVQALQEKLTGVESQQLILGMRISTLRSKQNAGPDPSELAAAKAQSVKNDPVVSQLQMQLAQMEQSYLLETSRRSEDSEELRVKKQEIETTKRAIEMARQRAEQDFDQIMMQAKAVQEANVLKGAEAELAELAAQAKLIQDELDKQNATVIALGRKGLAIKKLQDEIGLTRDFYQTLTQRIQFLQVERQRPARVSVYYQAEEPRTASSDKRPQLSIVLVIGAMVFGCAFVFLLQEVDPRVEIPQEVEARTGMRLLGTIPRFEDLDKGRVKAKHFVDDCRTIRVNLMLASGEKPVRTLVIASPQGRDGKTTLAINLATSVALSGKRVLLIDGDIRKPEVARYLRLDNSRGLSSVLAGECAIEEAIQSSIVPRLDILPSNRRAYRRNEIMAGSRLGEILVRLAAVYDEVVVDTPAALAMPDAKLWATLADGVLIVARSGKTSARDLVETKNRIHQTGARILGIVVTGVRLADSYEKYQHRYGEGYVDEPLSEEDWNATKVFLLSRQTGGHQAEFDFEMPSEPKEPKA